MTWREVTIAGYLVLLAAGLVLEVLGRREGSRVSPFGDLLTGAMSSRSGRVSVLAAWTWIGMHFLAR